MPSKDSKKTSKSARGKHKNLGDILIEQGLIDRETLEAALALQNRKLGEILVENKLVDSSRIAEALKLQAEHAGTAALLPSIRLSAEQIEELLDLLDQPENKATDALVSMRDRLEALLLEPVHGLVKKARAAAASSAREARKKIHLRFSADDVSIERAVAPDAFEILIHLLNNAIHHGVQAEGAAILVKLSLQGRCFHLRVRDEGCGIDFKAVAKKARQMGLTDKKDSELSQAELKKLLFAPGLSTKTKATALAGRGVGLDAVETALLRHRGSVDVQSEQGRFTEFSVTLPLQIFARRLVLVRFKNALYGIPTDGISDVKDLKADEIIGMDTFVVRCLLAEQAGREGSAAAIGVTRLASGEPVLVVESISEG